MVEIASTRAGRDLTKILVLMGVPIIALWLMFFFESKESIDTLKREQSGLAIAKILEPLFSNDEAVLTPGQLVEISRLEERLGLEMGKRISAEYWKHSVVTNADTEERGERLAALMHDVAGYSGLILDSDARSYFHISASLANLPDLSSDFDEFIEALGEIAESGKATQEDILRVLPLGWMAEESLERFEEQLGFAAVAEGTPEDFAPAMAALDELEEVLQKLQGLAKNLDKQGQAQELATLFKDDQLHETLHENVNQLFDFSFGRIESRIEERLSWLWNKLWFLTAVGFLFAATGVGYAFSMFSRTLKTLDTVEEAHAVSERSRLEIAAVNDRVAGLNVELAEKICHLRDAQDSLLKKARMEQLGQLTATVAHELRNPLGSVRTSAFLIEKKVENKGLGLEKQMERINKGILRCDNIITQLLDFSRTKEIEAEPQLMDHWLEERAPEMIHSLGGNVRVEFDLGLGDTKVPFDQARLERAVINLISNAAEAMVGDGRTEVKTVTIDPLIRVSTRLNGNTASIAVMDNGPGMTDDVLAKIRDPLFTTKSFGTGLGLPSVEQIANLHGGKLEIETAVGIGSTFRIILPLQATARTLAA